MQVTIDGITIKTTNEEYSQNWWGSPEKILEIYINPEDKHRIYVHEEGFELFKKFLRGINA